MLSSVKTFVFLDLEATGLNKYLPKITEICLVAAHISSLQNPVTNEFGEMQLPRVLDKLCLCVDPEKTINRYASEISGLNNKNLGENEKQNFNSGLIVLIKEFLDRQAKPVCLVAHNGFKFDFPLLKTELKEQGNDFSSSLLCLDTLHVFQELDTLENGAPKKGKGFYTLSELYRRSVGKEPIDSHHAEGDVQMLIMIFMSKAKQVIEKTSYSFKMWSEISPMYVTRR
ncbi:three prime repair exonuclease 2 [Spea bombifrons]|uniref:three prime repair exonuclease 2 n=1 Tax=Spea bombifrons TaxID=233779 RepID=UPI00234AE427|nr:three prime repair exonuclease 2 [Spea bombifrons]